MPRLSPWGAAAAPSRATATRVGASATAGPRRGATGTFAPSVEAVWYGTPWRGLILPPPGGVPYFATTSGGAMIALLPRTRVVSVIGILSSSTQTYSGSLGTSPNRGFLMRGQRVSADLVALEGCGGASPPRARR